MHTITLVGITVSYGQTCNGEWVDDSGDDQVRQGEVGDKSSSDAVAGGPAPANVLDDDRYYDDQVTQSSHYGCHTEHYGVERSENRLSTVQRPKLTTRSLRTVHFN